MSAEIATSINIHVPFSLSQIIMSGLLLGIVLSVCICWFHNIIIIIINIIHEVVLFNTLRRQYTASKQWYSAADNESL